MTIPVTFTTLDLSQFGGGVLRSKFFGISFGLYGTTDNERSLSDSIFIEIILNSIFVYFWFDMAVEVLIIWWSEISEFQIRTKRNSEREMDSESPQNSLTLFKVLEFSRIVANIQWSWNFFEGYSRTFTKTAGKRPRRCGWDSMWPSHQSSSSIPKKAISKFVCSE